MPRKDPRSRLARFALTLVLGVGLIGGGLAYPGEQAAAMVTAGPGYRIPHEVRSTVIGAYFAPGGTKTYCLEWGKEAASLPHDPEQQRTHVQNYREWGELETARVGALIAGPGQTESAEQAAAVAIAIWLRHPGTLDPFTPDHRFLLAAIPDAHTRGGILAEAHRLSAWMDTLLPDQEATAGVLRVLPDPGDAHRGSIEIAGLEQAFPGRLTLRGALLVGPDGEELPKEAREFFGNSVHPYRLVPSDDLPGSAPIEAEARIILPARTLPSGIVVWHADQNLQDVATAGAVPPAPEVTLRAQHTVDLRFAPEFSTQVPHQVLADDETLKDALRPRLAPGSQSWRRLADGTAVPLTVECTAYGPWAERPAVQATIPEGAPVAAGPLRVTVGGEQRDPVGVPVSFDYGIVPQQGGYYSTVCSLRQAHQETRIGEQVLPPGYEFADAFGLGEETQLVPTRLSFRTQLTALHTAPGTTISDSIRPYPLAGEWPQSQGAPISVGLVGEVFYSEGQPERATLPPKGQTPVLTLRAELSGEQEITVPFQVPDRAGWYTVRWCLSEPAGFVATPSGREAGLIADRVRPWCDDYGIPEETVQAVAPTPLATTGALPLEMLVVLPGLLLAAGIGALALRRRAPQR